jgi:hypothetical protein
MEEDSHGFPKSGLVNQRAEFMKKIRLKPHIPAVEHVGFTQVLRITMGIKSEKEKNKKVRCTEDILGG